MFFHIWSTQPRQSLSFSVTESVEGSTTMPPLPPPSGMSATAHFHVIQVARARTVSIVSLAAHRIPPLAGPRASLCWTRKPSKTLRLPSSIRTGMRKWNSRSGMRSIARTPASSPSWSATSSNWR